MKVKELLEKLKNYPEADVYIYSNGILIKDTYLDYWNPESILIAEK